MIILYLIRFIYEIDYNFQKAIKILNHIKSDLGFLIDYNRLSTVHDKSLREINFWFFFYDAKYLTQIRILILIANEMLYLTHYILEFHKGVIGGRKGKIYKKPKTEFFNFFNVLWELIFDDAIWKSLKFWAKWVVAAFCTTFP